MDKKCQIAHENMPFSFKKCQTNGNRLTALGFQLPESVMAKCSVAKEPSMEFLHINR